MKGIFLSSDVAFKQIVPGWLSCFMYLSVKMCAVGLFYQMCKVKTFQLVFECVLVTVALLSMRQELSLQGYPAFAGVLALHQSREE